MRHLQPHALIPAFHIEALVRFGAIENRLGSFPFVKTPFFEAGGPAKGKKERVKEREKRTL